MDALTYARVHDHLAKLKLDRMAAVLDRLAADAAREDWPYLQFLDRLLDEEVATRLARSVEMRTKMARFPFLKTLDQFDFAFQPSIDERQVRDLAALRFLANAENVILLGPPGVGKTHCKNGTAGGGGHDSKDSLALDPVEMPWPGSVCPPPVVLCGAASLA
jgi:DNA replication protein DnaC